MSIPSIIRRYLAGTGGQFNIRTVGTVGSVVEAAADAEVPLEKLARAVMVKSGLTPLMVILRGDQEPDLEQLASHFRRSFEYCSNEESSSYCLECDVEWLPPLPEAFGLKGIIDKGLNDLDEIFFASGVPGQYLHTSGDTFYSMLQNCWRDRTVSLTRHEDSAEELLDINDIYRQKVQALSKLPTMPGIATEIMRVRNNPYAMASELAAVIEQDPSLSAQLFRYAASPLYGVKVNSVEQAIVRVLGMDFVIDFAFGLAVGKSFHNPKEGAIGLNAYWLHALHAASLTQALCKGIDYSRAPSSSMAYLSGLMHNIGFLLLGHLFPAQFARLNEAIELQPQRPVTDIEKEELELSHTEMGLWLMEAWNMPREVAVAVEHHHDINYSADFAVYANLVTVANRLLKRHGIGDAETTDIPSDLLEAIGIDRAKAEAALATVMGGSAGLTVMASKMAA